MLGPAVVSVLMLKCVFGLPMMRMAPTECPLENGNLLDVHLFVSDEAACKLMCQDDENCIFYHYYKGSKADDVTRQLPADEDEYDGAEKAESQPSQCFLYDACSRSVLPATDDCPLTKENTVKVEAFVPQEEDCKMSCSDNDLCGYYKHFSANNTKQPLMCYHLRKCSPRVIRRAECPLERNNYIDHYLFTKTSEECKQKCQDHGECRFYHWYPIDYSPAPNYCYLYRSCQGGSDEMRIAYAIAGRHPGHYFLGNQVSADEIRGATVCQKTVDLSLNESAGRAAAVAEYVGKEIVLCGGRHNDVELDEVVADCLAFKPRTGVWYSHSTLLSPREEAASVVLSGHMYILGGIVDSKISDTTEMLDEESWSEGPTLPEARARHCAVALNNNAFAILGGEIQGSATSADFKVYHVDNDTWITMPDMLVNRKDHACTLVTFGEQQGILVSGGVTNEDQLLDSVEFFSFDEASWKEMAHLKQGRTEHGMAVIAGLPTVIGGVSDKEFLASIEVLDNSADDTNAFGMEWRVAAYAMSSPRYDFAVVTVPISGLKRSQRSMTDCYNDQVVIEH